MKLYARIALALMSLGACVSIGAGITLLGIRGTILDTAEIMHILNNYVGIGIAIFGLGFFTAIAYSRTEQRSTIYCRYCGNEIPATSAFCPECDRALI